MFGGMARVLVATALLTAAWSTRATAQQSCDDLDPCTEQDSCAADGNCHGTPKPDFSPCEIPFAGDCTTLAQCQTFTVPVIGSITQCLPMEHKLAGTPCTPAFSAELGNCVKSAQCDDEGICEPELVTCESPDLCTEAACNPATGLCESAPKSCDDDCSTAQCDPGTGNCINKVPRTDGTGCDDGNPCTGNDSCRSGQCQGVAVIGGPTPPATASATGTNTVAIATPTQTATDTVIVVATATRTQSGTPTSSPTATETQTSSPTATLTATLRQTPESTATPLPCDGDCDDSGDVSPVDVLTMIHSALGYAPSDEVCPLGDRNKDGEIKVDEILAAENSAINRCPGPIPTGTPVDTETPVPATATSTNTATTVPTATVTDTVAVPTATSTDTVTPQATSTDTTVPVATVTDTPVPPSATTTHTATPEATGTDTTTPAETATPTRTHTTAPSLTPTSEATETNTVVAPSPTLTSTTAPGTATPTPTEELPTASPSPSATATLPAATATATPTSPEATATHSPSATPTGTFTPTDTPETPSPTPTPTPTETLEQEDTPTPTETPIPTVTATVDAGVASRAAGMTNTAVQTLRVIPELITPLTRLAGDLNPFALQANEFHPLVPNTPTPTATPKTTACSSGTRSFGCSLTGHGVSYILHFDSCVLDTSNGGSLTLDGTMTADAQAGSCSFPPTQLTNVNVTQLMLTAKDAQAQTTLAATLNFTNSSLSATEFSIFSPCVISQLTMTLSGTAAVQSGQRNVTLTFTGTQIVLDLNQFSDDCVPVDYDMTINNEVDFGGDSVGGSFMGNFTDFVLSDNTTTGDDVIDLSGRIDALCVGTPIDYDTDQSLTLPSGQACPSAGSLLLTHDGQTDRVSYSDGGLTIDVDDDDSVDASYGSCLAMPLYECVG